MKLKKKPEMDEMIPLKFYLSQNYPNPFKDKTTIKYCVAYKTRVHLTVFNSEREKVDTLINEIKDPGTYEIEFQSLESNDKVTNESYYYRLAAGNYKSEKKMERMK